MTGYTTSMESTSQSTPPVFGETSMAPTQKKSPVSTYVLIAILALAAVLSGFNYFFKPFSEYTPFAPSENPAQETEQVVSEPTVPLSRTEKVDAIVSSLTPDEKIAQLIALPIEAEDFLASIAAQVAERQEFQKSKEAASEAYVGFLTGDTLTEEEAQMFVPPEELFLKDWGFVTLFGSNISHTQATQITSYIDDKNTQDIPVWVMVDHEGGTVQRLGGTGFTDLPSWQEQCAGELLAMAEPWKASASELSQVGVDVVLAPVLDIAQAHPILKSRVCSADAAKIYEFSTAFITTYNDAGILPVLKHFPGIGPTRKDLHTAFDTVDVQDESVSLYRSLLEVYPYSAVMTGHVGVTSQDETTPCSLSSDCVGQLYELFPSVLTITDALEMKATGVDNKTVYLEDVALEAVKAGNTVLLFGPTVTQSDVKIVHDRLLREYNNSFEFRELVNKHVRLIVEYKVAK